MHRCSKWKQVSHLVLCMCAFVCMSDDVKCNFVRPTYSRQDLLCIGIQCECAITRDFMHTHTGFNSHNTQLCGDNTKTVVFCYRDMVAFICTKWIGTGCIAFYWDRNKVSGNIRVVCLCVYVQNNWCVDSGILANPRFSDLEYITVKCRPFYLPHKFCYNNYSCLCATRQKC